MYKYLEIVWFDHSNTNKMYLLHRALNKQLEIHEFKKIIELVIFFPIFFYENQTNYDNLFICFWCLVVYWFIMKQQVNK